ncbi:uncharacterized protein EURHEDRAFT_415628 [Aspergillus ruber CBS 135680]|uniref:Uncharacterized protein n=1 Tax=Aspergillus ruber (strain CBS 135680) TaxID=1388766 RepID=A0A017S5U2_ASPRC|nr:uncharacterized protein EURHEDRAFT_415628 [Aspergillus ruber CBS 135680]EYE92211.1 hypothetical protein EURHEDRAFT_415628 [Aspergillus ruber CBS 135680]
MADYKLSVRYENKKAYDTYSKVLLHIVNLRFISKGAQAVEPLSADDEQPLVETTTLRAISAITLGELREVDLGPGLLTEVHVQEKRSEAA